MSILSSISIQSSEEVSLTSSQLHCSQMLCSMVGQATNPETLVTLCIGGWFAQAAKLSCFKLLSSATQTTSSRLLSNRYFHHSAASFFGCAMEGGFFATAPLLIRGEGVDLDHSTRASFHLSLTIGICKTIGVFVPQNVILQSCFQDLAIVTTDKICEKTGIVEARFGSWTERIVDAQGTLFQLQLSAKLLMITCSSHSKSKALYEIKYETARSEQGGEKINRSSLNSHLFPTSQPIPLGPKQVIKPFFDAKELAPKEINQTRYFSIGKGGKTGAKKPSLREEMARHARDLMEERNDNSAYMLAHAIIAGSMTPEAARARLNNSPLLHNYISGDGFNWSNQMIKISLIKMSDGTPITGYDPDTWVRERRSVLSYGEGTGNFIYDLLIRSGHQENAPLSFRDAPFLAIDGGYPELGADGVRRFPIPKENFIFEQGDRTVFMINSLQRRFPNHYRFGLFQSDILDLETGERMLFDEIVSLRAASTLMAMMWKIEGIEGIEQMLRRFILHLKPGGRLYLDPIHDAYISLRYKCDLKVPQDEEYFTALRKLSEKFKTEGIIKAYNVNHQEDALFFVAPS